MTRFLFSLAGLPRNALDEAIRRPEKLFGQGIDIVGKPLDVAGVVPMPSYEYRYVRSFIDMLYGKFNRLISKTDAGLHCCVVFVDFGSPTNERFYEVLFPSCFVASVPNPGHAFGAVGSVDWNVEIFRRLRAMTMEVKEAGGAIRHQLTSNANRTSLLLPIRNFRSAHLQGHLRRANAELLGSADKVGTVRSLEQEFATKHPPQRVGESPRRCYVDDRSVAFVPPGSTARHGYPRALKDPHVPACMVSSMFRLGAPYDRCFHYDCVESSGSSVDGDFMNCHGESGRYVGTPHLNVAANDQIR